MTTLLLVDADPLSLRVLDVSLRKAGFDVTTASDAVEALAKTRGAPDLLVTDTRLREGDGFSLVETLRARTGATEVPVIFISRAESGEAAEERERARELGIEDILPKPVFVRELLARAQLVLARRAQRSVEAGPTRGTTREMALVDLLQTLEATHTTGVVHLDHDGDTARIYLRDGNVVDAELGRVRGADVVVIALGWEDTDFRVEPGPVDNDDLIECSTHALLLRAMDRLDGRTPTPETAAPVVEPAPTAAPRHDTQPAPAPEIEAKVIASPNLDSRSGPGPELDESSIAATALDTKADTGVEPPAVPSTAPWTREAIPSDAPAPETDLRAAGVPGASTRKNQRIALMAAGAAAALLVVLGLQSIHARNVREAEQAREGLPIATAAAAPAPPNEPPMSPVNAIAAAAPATPEPAEPGAASATAIDAPAPGADTLGAASATPAAPAVDGHEKMLDVKTDLHSRSPLVRDAQRALLKGDTARAIALAQQAVATNSADADGWLTLAAARKASGDGSGARDAYTQCIAKGYTVGVMSCRALAAQATAGAAPTAPAKGSW